MTGLVSSQNLNEVVAQLLELPQGSPIAVDCETTGLHPYLGDTLRGFSFAFHVKGTGDIVSWYVPVGYPDWTTNLSETAIKMIAGAIKSVDPVYVYHHAKFDLRFLRQLPRHTNGGVYFPVPETDKLWDTKIVAWLIDENLSSSLDFQALHHLGEPKIDFKPIVKERGGWDKVTAADTAEYGAKDAELTLRLREVQIELLSHPMTYGNPSAAIAREHAIMGVLLRMEDTGVQIDQDRLKTLWEEAEKECVHIEQSFLADYGVNINSPGQLAEFLFVTLDVARKDGQPTDKPEYDVPVYRKDGTPWIKKDGTQRTKTSFPSVAVDVLKALEESPLVNSIMQQRRLRKTISSYYEPYARYVADDSRLHATFWQHGTVTGRFSCADPNLQTVPREDKLSGVRELFVAADGYELWEYDLKAAEQRVVAGMSQEQLLIEGIMDGTDMHALLAAQVFGADFTGIQRRYAKNIGYGFYYGLKSPQTASKYIEGPGAKKLAMKILDGLAEMYPEIVKLMRTEEAKANADGYVRVHPTAWPGRYRRYVTEAADPPKTYTALNAQVQGGIGEFVKDVMLASEAPLNLNDARLCLQIHDALVIEVPEGSGEWFLKLLNDIAETINPFDLPMVFTGQPFGAHE